MRTRKDPAKHQSKHLVLVVHGSRAERDDVRHLVQWVRGKGHLVEVKTTWGAGDAAAHAAHAACSGVDVVVAVGGDGTINEVVNGLDGYDIPLGIIPVGTANDLAAQVGIPLDPDHAMDVILRRKPRRLDTAAVNGRRFLNMSTGGVGAEATAETPASVKAALGPMAYAISGVRKLADLSPRPVTVLAEGFSFSGEALVFAVGVMRSSGGGTMLAPEASTTDGLLDICVVEAMSRRDFARLALKVKRGEHIGSPGVHYAQVPWVTITTTSGGAVNVDGESVVGSSFRYHARARDLLVHVARLPGEAAA